MTIDPELWERHRARIERFYYQEKLPFHEVRRIHQDRGSLASRAAYVRQLAKWNRDQEIQSTKQNK
jgi:hypothetical protein